MKIELDKKGRRLYKFSHSAAKGGNVYIHKTFPGKVIRNKQGLRNALAAISKRYILIDTTIKIYDGIFFFFSHIPKSLAPAEIIGSIGKNIPSFAEWDKEYVFTGVYGLHDRFLRNELEKWGYDHEKG